MRIRQEWILDVVDELMVGDLGEGAGGAWGEFHMGQ